MSSGSFDSLDHGQTGADTSAVPERITSLGDQSTAADTGPSVSDLDSPITPVSRPAQIQPGRYRVERELGSGGMGEVLLATDTELDRRVALKRLKAEISNSSRALERFQTEARAIAALDHPSIVRVHDFGFDEQGPVLVLEYVDGLSLADRLSEGPVEIGQAVRWACSLCEALDMAHRRGIVHRDIKPANILLTLMGVPKLSDFGLARRETHDGTKTQAGVVLGTLDFMAPEQRRDASTADARSDLWSLGATLYQMLTGRSPRVLRFDHLPEQLRPVLGRVLEDDPDLRYPNALEFKAALEESVRDPAPLERWRKRAEGLRDTVRQMVDSAAPHSSSEVPTPVISGLCPACGTECEPDRSYCPGCGHSLQLNCLQCDAEIAAWERYCPACGVSQQELVETRRREIDALKQEAEQAAAARRSWDAIRSARLAQQLAEPKYGIPIDWANQLVSRLMNEQSRLDADLRTMLATARQQLAEKNYDAVLTTLRPLDGQTAGFAEQSQELLECHRLRQTALQTVAEADALQDEILRAVNSGKQKQLLPKMNRLLEIRPGHTVISLLRDRLQAKETEKLRKSARLNERLSSARWYQEQNDHESVLELLGQLPEAALDEQTLAVLNWARTEQQHEQERQAKTWFFQRSWFIIAVCATVLLVLVDWASRFNRRGNTADPLQASVPADQATVAIPALNNFPDASSSVETAGDPPGSTANSSRAESGSAVAGAGQPPRSSGGEPGRTPSRNGDSGTDTTAGRPAQRPSVSPPAETEPTPADAAVPVGQRAGEIRTFTQQRLPFVWCPPGTARVGSPPDEPAWAPGEDLRLARLTEGFWLSQTEVTQGTWTAVTGSSPWTELPENLSRFVRTGQRFPASNISVSAAILFCRQLTERERAANRLPDDWAYMLPDETQWEYACRSGTTTAWSSGDDPAALSLAAWHEGNTTQEQFAHQVASRQPNAWQLFDMHGNVMEVCRAATLPGAKAEAASPGYVLRGGAWLLAEPLLRSAARVEVKGDSGSLVSGLRLMLAPVSGGTN